MNIHQAIDRVLGKSVATAIVNDQGLHWAVVAALAGAKVSHGPGVMQAMRTWLIEDAYRCHEIDAIEFHRRMSALGFSSEACDNSLDELDHQILASTNQFT